MPRLLEKARRTWRGQDGRTHLAILYDSDKGPVAACPRHRKGGLAALEKAAYEEAMDDYKERR